MKRFLIGVISIVILGSAGFYYYTNYYNREKTNLIDLVPNTAFAVYSNTNFATSWNSFLETSFWKNVGAIPNYAKVNNSIRLLDSLSGNQGQLVKLLRDNNFLVSAHVTSRESSDLIFYFDLNDPANSETGIRLLEHFRTSEKGETTRTSQGKTIYVIEGKGDQSFSYIVEDNLFAGTFTSFLIEDVVRNINSGFETNFLTSNPELITLPSSANDEGDLLIDYKLLASYLGTFTGTSNRFVADIAELLQAGRFDVTVSDNDIVLNGFSLPAPSSSINVFNGQQPAGFSLRNMVSNRTALTYHIGVSNPMLWHDALTKYRSDRSDPFLDTLQKYRDSYDFNVERVVNWLGDEIAVSTLESIDQESLDKILLIKSADVTDALNQLNQLTDRVNNASGDTLYYEYYGDEQIRQLPLSEIPQCLFGATFSGFPLCFYAAAGNTLILTNSVQSMKYLLADIENEDVWSKSLEQEEFIQKTINQSNLSIYVNTARAWDILLSNASEGFANTLEDYAPNFRRFDKLAIQFGNVDNKYFTTVSVQHQQSQPQAQGGDFEYLYANNSQSRIITRPYIVRNHNTGKLEVLYQDERNDLALIGNDGELLWKDSVSGRISSDVYQIDYYRNSKLQYIYSAGNEIHAVDRLGKELDGFPLVFEYEIDQFNVIDYDNSKRYRLVTADKYGNVYLYDKAGKNLEGWTPLRFESRLVNPPMHIRVRGRDRIVITEETGKVTVVNRRGELVQGFPVSLNSTISNPLYIEIGSSFDRTYFNTITDNGELIRFDLQGKVVGQTQFYRPNRDSRFYLVEDGLGKTFVVARKDMNRVTFMSRGGKELFQKDYISGGDLEIQYYNFGSGNEVFIVADSKQQVTYIYNAKGDLVNNRPLVSGRPVGLMYFGKSGKFNVFFTAENSQGIAEFYQ